MPMPVITGAAKYPENILEKINLKVDAINANQPGLEKAVNITLLGRLARHYDFDKDC